jgi:enoyl-CoA hydratase/carnithine racemase
MSVERTPIIYREKGGIAFIEINRPEKKNALNYECWQLFDEQFEILKSNNKIRSLVIGGRAEDIFSAGIDVTPTDKFISDMFQALENKEKAKLVEGFAYFSKERLSIACHRICKEHNSQWPPGFASC